MLRAAVDEVGRLRFALRRHQPLRRIQSSDHHTPPGAIDALGKDDVVILPAFGVTVGMLQRLGYRVLKAAGPAEELIKLLEVVGERLPDLAPVAADLAFKLKAAVDVQALTAVAVAIPKELGDIAQGHIDARRHPSDAI